MPSVCTGLLIVLLAFFSCAPPVCLGADGCLAAGCHPEIRDFVQVHTPVAEGECSPCHRPTGEKHPTPGSPGFQLAAAGGELCRPCHQPPIRPGMQHPITDKRECLACHNPHGASAKNLLVAGLPETCLPCHADIGTRIREAKTRHAPMYRPQSCSICHSLHGSPNPHLLTGRQQDLCLSCHGRDDFSKSKPLRNIAGDLQDKAFLHGPLADGDCTGCHEPHGSDFFRLLTGSYPAEFYAGYQPGIYGFCFQCHEQKLLQDSRTTAETRFRDGNRNLHYLHVRDRKGRTCLACHEPHAGNNRQLIRAAGAPFGNWQIPVGFRLTPTGGSCAPGCHPPRAYDRKSPPKKEFPAKATSGTKR